MGAQILLHDSIDLNTTIVPNTFIDQYMTKANGEYVKVYLYLLRCLNARDMDLSIAKLADAFDYTESDIKRALYYWEKVNLLNLEYSADGNITGIYFLHSKSTASAPSKNVKSTTMVKDFAPSIKKEEDSMEIPVKPEYTKNQLVSFSGQEDIAQLLFIAEQYLGRTMNANDISNVLYWHSELHFAVDLIEYLIEFCVSKKHTSMHYIEKTAQLWYQENVTTVLAAKQLSKINGPMNQVVMKALGIKGRNLADSECAFVNKWSTTWRFDSELISEACRRTIAKTHQPSFEYTDSILKSWHDNQVKVLADVNALDEAFRSKTYEAAAKMGKKAQSTSKESNKFNNFAQRAYDFDDFERQMLTQS